MNSSSKGNEIVQEISIKSTAERVFRALTSLEERSRWWGGGDGRFKIVQFDSDLRVGGKWTMRIEAYGKLTTIRGEYKEIDPPRLLVYTWLPDWYENATESLVRWDVEERDGVTTVRLTHSGLTEAGRENHRGWPQILGWLKAHVEQA